MKSRVFFVFLMLLAVSNAIGQSVNGKVVDSSNNAIVGASVVLWSSDSVLVDVVLTQQDGTFTLPCNMDYFRLIVQHVAYHPKEIFSKDKSIGIIVLHSNDSILNELIVTAERPMVSVEDGALVYNLETLVQNTTVTNTYEAIKRIPGGMENADETLSLLGASSLTVIIDGKPSTMSGEQLTAMLKMVPIDRVQKVEVLYSAPPQYHVRGAAINLVLRKNNDYSLQGEVGGNYQNRFFDNYGVNGNFRLTTPKWSLDLMCSTGYYTSIQKYRLASLHMYGDSLYDIRQKEDLRGKSLVHSYRLGFDYYIGKESSLSVAYTGQMKPNHSGTTYSHGNFQTAFSTKDVDKDYLHNISLGAKLGAGLSLGIDYTDYQVSGSQIMDIVYSNGTTADIYVASGQHIRSLSLYADKSHTLGKGWTLGYGATYKYTDDNDFQNSSRNDNSSMIDNSLEEHTSTFYISTGKQYTNGVNFRISATGEYYKIGNYKKYSFYPQASLTWFKNPNHIWQSSVSTNKNYPSYWALQSAVTYIDGYSEVHGTPGLHPSTTYDLNVNYIYRQKYVAGLFHTYRKEYFSQVPYQSSERLALIYKMLNWDYMATTGVNVVIPVKVDSWLDSRLMLVGMNIHQRCDDYFDLSFRRDDWVFVGNIDNSFILSNGFTLELGAFVQTPASQGTFDIKTVWSVNGGLKYTFAKKKAVFALKCNDIFNTSSPYTSMNYKGQKMSMDNNFYTRYVSLDFIYRFGGYKKREVKEIDTSRFGH